MAGNPKTSKSVAPKSAQTKPGSKGVRVGVNPKATTQSTAVTSKMTKMKMGGSMKGKKC
jgi:hypothetical protein